MRTLFMILFLIPQNLGNVIVPTLNGLVGYDKVEVPVNMQKVTLTIYKPTAIETDSTPNVTASGFKIDTINPDKHRIVAISRDLKKKGWGFGKKIRIRKGGKYNGVYTIKDVMNKRHKNRVDVLVGSDHAPIRLENVEITLID